MVYCGDIDKGDTLGTLLAPWVHKLCQVFVKGRKFFFAREIYKKTFDEDFI